MTDRYKTKRTPVLTHRSSLICSIVYQLMKNKKLFLVQCHRLMPLAAFTTLCLQHCPWGLSLPHDGCLAASVGNRRSFVRRCKDTKHVCMCKYFCAQSTVFFDYLAKNRLQVSIYVLKCKMDIALWSVSTHVLPETIVPRHPCALGARKSAFCHHMRNISFH